MLAFFHSLGKHSLSRQFLKRIASGFAIEEAHIFIIRIVISSWPWALLGSNDLIIFTISPGQISKVDNLSSVTKLVFAGIALLLSIVVHCFFLIYHKKFLKEVQKNKLSRKSWKESIQMIQTCFCSLLSFFALKGAIFSHKGFEWKKSNQVKEQVFLFYFSIKIVYMWLQTSS